MNKLAILIVFVLVIRNTLLFGQSKIDKVAFDNLVDYVNCKYTAAYIESIRNKDIHKLKVRDYDNNIKSKIENVTVQNSLHSDELRKLLEDNNIKETATSLTAKIGARKDSFNTSWTNQEAIDYALRIDDISSVFGSILGSTHNDLKVKLYKEFVTFPEIDTQGPSSEIIKEMEESNAKPNNFWLWLIIGFEGILLIGFILVSISLFRSKVISIVKDSDRIRAYIKAQNNSSNVSIPYTSVKPSLSEKEINAIVDIVVPKVIECIELEKKDNSKQIIISPEIDTQKKLQIQYLKQRNGSIFNQVSTNSVGCYFEIFDIQNNMAKFRFSGNENYAINNKNEVFDDVCEVSGTSYDAKKVQPEENGEVELQSDGKWRVTKKAKIKFL